MENYRKGKKLLDEERFEEALIQFRSGLESGDIRCHYGVLAICAMTGQDRTEALEQLRNIMPALHDMANEGDEDACFIMGRCYETGSAVLQNVQEALRYYAKAAMHNNLDALFNMGCIYISYGDETEELAVRCWRRAAGFGHKEAKAALKYYRNGEPDRTQN